MIKSLLISLIILPAMISSAFAMGVCDNPLRDSETCYKMRHLRSQINLMDAQRDLMQVNYPFMMTLGQDVSELVEDLLTNNNSTGILNGLQGVQAAVNPVIEYSRMNDSRALASANQVRKQCLTCHSTYSPRSGYSWAEISQQSWSTISKKCNDDLNQTDSQYDHNYGTTPRNPYRCKSMHGMFAALEYFMTAKQANRLNYQMTEMASTEIIRISDNLINMSMAHQYNPALLQGVNAQARELYQLSNAQDPRTDSKRLEISYSCSNCHSSN